MSDIGEIRLGPLGSVNDLTIAAQELADKENEVIRVLLELAARKITWDDIDEKPEVFPADLSGISSEEGNSPVSVLWVNIEDVPTTLEGFQLLGEVQSIASEVAQVKVDVEMTEHLAEVNPHPQYLHLDSDGDLLISGNVGFFGDTAFFGFNTFGGQTQFDDTLILSAISGSPFLLGPSAGLVPNLDSDKLDGKHASELLDRSTHTGTQSPTTISSIFAWLYQTVAQAIPNAVNTALTLDTVGRDTHNMYDAGTPERLTVPAGMGGLWTLDASVAFAANTTGQRRMGIRVNGTTFVSQQRIPPITVAASATIISTSATVELAAGDYLEVMAYQDTGASLNTNVTVGSYNRLAATFLGTLS